MSGDGGGRASQIYRGWRWLVVGRRSRVSTLFGLSAGKDLVARGRARCEHGSCLWRLPTSAGLALMCGPVSWPKCCGGSPVGGGGSVGGGLRLLRVTSVLRCPLAWIWALPVDVGVPV
jgi:hypothetical protein